MINEDEINEIQINGSSVSVNTSTLDLTDGYAWSSRFVLPGLDLRSSLNATSSTIMYLSIAFRELLYIDDELSSKGIFIFDVATGLNLKSSIKLGFLVSFAAGLNFTGSSETTKQAVISFIEAIKFTDASMTNHRAMVAFAAALDLDSDINSGFSVEFLESLGLDADMSFGQLVNFLETLLVEDASTSSARLFFLAEEGIDFDSELASKGNLSAIFEEGVTIGGLLDTPEGLFEAWVVNAESRAPYQYTNFPFNSFAVIDGIYYGVDEGGLFSLDGDTDDGESIDASLKTGLMNLGTTLFKRIPRAYIGYTTNNQILLKTISTEEGVKIERWYELKKKGDAEDTTNARVKMARGVKSVHWQFEIVNVDGADFDISDIKLMPTILKRRR